MTTEIKNTLAKVLILLWIVSLIILSLVLVRVAISFDVNYFFNLTDEKALSHSIVIEAKVLLLMFAVSIIGGISFMIKDFYRSIKYANLYEMAYQDYLNHRIAFDEFQRLIPIDVYTGRFNFTWTYWFLIQPLLSSVLGLIAFAIARSGLGVLQGTQATSEITIQSLYLYAVLTFLAGFSSHKFIAWLDRLADKIFSTTLPDRHAEAKASVIEASLGDRQALKEKFDLDEVQPPSESTSKNVK